MPLSLRNLGSAETTFGPGRADTTANLGPGGHSGMSSIQALLDELIRRKMAGPAKAGPMERPLFMSGGNPTPAQVAGPSERPAPRADTSLSAADKYAAALRPRYAFGSGSQHYELEPWAYGDPDIRKTLPNQSSYQPSNDAERAQTNAADSERFGRETAMRKKIQALGYAY